MPLEGMRLAACESVQGFLFEYLDACVFQITSDGILENVRRRKFPPNDKGVATLARWVGQRPLAALVTRFPERWPDLFEKLSTIRDRCFNAVWARDYATIANVRGDAKTTATLIASAVRWAVESGHGPSVFIGRRPWPPMNCEYGHGLNITLETDQGFKIINTLF